MRTGVAVGTVYNHFADREQAETELATGQAPIASAKAQYTAARGGAAGRAVGLCDGAYAVGQGAFGR